MYRLRMGSGFTLLEILVTVVIIAIISTVGLISYRGVLISARDSARKGELRSLKLALEQYQLINGSYPSTGGAWWGESIDGGSQTQTYIPGLAPTYIKKLPNDPKVNQVVGTCCPAGNDTGWWYRSDGVDYKVSAWCLPEGNTGTAETNPFWEPVSPSCAWQISTPDAAGW